MRRITTIEISKMKRLIFLIFILCSVSYGANDFSGDDNCKAYFRLESGAVPFLADSKGTNTLTNSGMAEDTTDYKEGACSCYANALTDILYRSDADLDAGFPFKSGDSTKILSVCGWFRASSFPASANRNIVNKYSASTGGRSWSVGASKSTTWRVALSVGYNSGNSAETILHGSEITTGVWYHFGVTYNDADKSYRIRVWDDNAGAILGSDATGNSTNNMYAGTGLFSIGRPGSGNVCLGGEKDEIVVFNDVLTAGEIDQIRAGTYGAGDTEDEIRAFVPGKDIICYSIVREIDGDVWYVAGDTFEAWGGGAGRDMADYDIALTDKSGDMFVGSMDTDISAGYYHILTFIRLGDNPDDDDPAVWQEYGYWSGTEWQPQNFKTIEDKVDTIAIDVAGLDGDVMRGTDGVSLVVPDAAGTAAALHAVTDALIEEVIARLKRIWAYP